jgi:hypothetical protein
MQDASAIATGGWETEAQAFADALIDHRAGYWLAGDIAKRMLAAATTEPARKLAANQLATMARCTVPYLKMLVALSDAFPQEYRYPDVPQSVYRACQRASQRIKQPATRILADALRTDWRPARIYAIGRAHDAIVRIHGQCIACGGGLRFYRRGTPGLMIPCPGCLADARHERRALLDSFVIIGPLA